ncbi:cysteine-rich KTR domain-containing protein [Gardnerella greenwoodii]
MCPVCGNKTRLKIREDTELKKFPPLLSEMQTRKFN